MLRSIEVYGPNGLKNEVFLRLLFVTSNYARER